MTTMDKEEMCAMIARGSSKVSLDTSDHLNHQELSTARTGDIQNTVNALGSFLDRSEFNIDAWKSPEVETLYGEGIGEGIEFEPEMTGMTLAYDGGCGNWENSIISNSTITSSHIADLAIASSTTTMDISGDLNVSGLIATNGGTVSTFYQDSEPENPKTGDLWFNQYRNTLCYWNGASWGYFLMTDLGDTGLDRDPTVDSEESVNTDEMYVDPSQFMEPDTIAHDTRTEYVIRDKSSDQFLSTSGTLTPDLRDIQIFSSMKDAESVRRAFDHPMEYDVRPLVISLTVLG